MEYIFVFRKIWRALFSGNTRFEIRPTQPAITCLKLIIETLEQGLKYASFWYLYY